MKSKLDSREQNNVHATPFEAKNELKIDYHKFLQKVQLVAIVNCTPDSFYDGGRYAQTQQAIEHGKQLIEEGADWIDVGGESTRPGATAVETKEELRRVLPVIEALSPLIPVSIDTRNPIVAEQALMAGATMINDVSGFTQPAMCELAAKSQVLCCIMHAQGTPATMQINPSYPKGVIHDIYNFFQETLNKLESYGISKQRLLLDPGLGFGKTKQHNFEIIAHLSEFYSLGCPLYLGMSRKSFLKTTSLQNASLSATLTCATVSALSGVCYLRVHDVKEHREMLSILEQIAWAKESQIG